MARACIWRRQRHLLPCFVKLELRWKVQQGRWWVQQWCNLYFIYISIWSLSWSENKLTAAFRCFGYKKNLRWPPLHLHVFPFLSKDDQLLLYQNAIFSGGTTYGKVFWPPTAFGPWFSHDKNILSLCKLNFFEKTDDELKLVLLSLYSYI